MRVTEKEFHNRCVRLDPLALDLRDARAELAAARDTDIVDLLADNARLRRLLERNWIHDQRCKLFYGEPCNCLDAALDDGEE